MRKLILSLAILLGLTAAAEANFGGVAVRQRVVVRQRFAPVQFRSNFAVHSFASPVVVRQRFAVQSFGYGHGAAFVQPFSYGYAAPFAAYSAPVLGFGADCYGGAGFSAGFRSRAFLGLGFGY